MATSKSWIKKGRPAEVKRALTKYADDIIEHHIMLNKPFKFKIVSGRKTYSGPRAHYGSKGVPQDVTATLKDDQGTILEHRMIFNRHGHDIFNSDVMVNDDQSLNSRFYEEITIENGEMTLYPSDPVDLQLAQFMLLHPCNQSNPMRGRKDGVIFKYVDSVRANMEDAESDKQDIYASSLIFDAADNDIDMLITQAEIRGINTELIKDMKGKKDKLSQKSFDEAKVQLVVDLRKRAKLNAGDFVKEWNDPAVEAKAAIILQEKNKTIGYNKADRTWYLKDEGGNFGEQIGRKLGLSTRDHIQALANQAVDDPEILELIKQA